MKEFDSVIFNLFIIGYFCRGNINTLDEYGYNYFVNEFHYFKLFKDLFPENEITDQGLFHELLHKQVVDMELFTTKMKNFKRGKK